MRGTAPCPYKSRSKRYAQGRMVRSDQSPLPQVAVAMVIVAYTLLLEILQQLDASFHENRNARNVESGSGEHIKQGVVFMHPDGNAPLGQVAQMVLRRSSAIRSSIRFQRGFGMPPKGWRSTMSPGVAALRHAWPEVERMRGIYDTRRRRLIQGLRELGFQIPVEPKGAFYIFTSCAHLTPDDYKLAFDILEKSGVAVAPGRDFGPGGHGFLRFSYCNSMENIEQGLIRRGDYLARHYPGAVK